MKKVLSILIVFIMTATLLCGCAKGEMAEVRNDTEFQIWLNHGSCFVYSFKDEETGVWYISTSEGVTPRLNVDGSLYTN